MKRIITLIAITLLMSCSSSDESNDISIAGKWYLQNDFEDGEDVAKNCEKDSYLDIKSDLTGYLIFYSESNGTCQVYEEGSFKLNIDNNSRYYIVGASPDEKIIREGNTLKIIYLDDPDTYMVFKK